MRFNKIRMLRCQIGVIGSIALAQLAMVQLADAAPPQRLIVKFRAPATNRVTSDAHARKRSPRYRAAQALFCSTFVKQSPVPSVSVLIGKYLLRNSTI